MSWYSVLRILPHTPTHIHTHTHTHPHTHAHTHTPTHMYTRTHMHTHPHTHTHTALDSLTRYTWYSYGASIIFVGQNIEHRTMNILTMNEATLTTMKIVITNLLKLWTTNTFTPENYPLYGIKGSRHSAVPLFMVCFSWSSDVIIMQL